MISDKISKKTGVTISDVEAVLEALADQLVVDLRIRGEFKLLNLATITTEVRPAEKAKNGTNPFTGEEMEFKEKPPRTRVRFEAKKKLKDALNKNFKS